MAFIHFSECETQIKQTGEWLLIISNAKDFQTSISRINQGNTQQFVPSLKQNVSFLRNPVGTSFDFKIF